MEISKKKRGPVSKKVKRLTTRLFNGNLDDNGFKSGIREIIEEYGETGYIHQGIGLAIAKWTRDKKPSEQERVWELADSVDIRIREKYEDHLRIYGIEPS